MWICGVCAWIQHKTFMLNFWGISHPSLDKQVIIWLFEWCFIWLTCSLFCFCGALLNKRIPNERDEIVVVIVTSVMHTDQQIICIRLWTGSGHRLVKLLTYILQSAMIYLSLCAYITHYNIIRRLNVAHCNLHYESVLVIII